MICCRCTSKPPTIALARELLDRLDIARADVLGLSFGGLVAQQLAYDAPTRVRGWSGLDVVRAGSGAQ